MEENKKLERLTQKCLTDRNIIKRLGGRTKIVMYDEFKDFNTIEEVLSPWDNTVFLLKTEDDFGHWMCMKRTGKRISFFDSYGEFPDIQKRHLDKKYCEESGQKYNKLCELLYEASFRYTIEFSEHKYQSSDPKVSTCGQWCCLFIESGLLTDDFKTYIDECQKEFKLKSRDQVCVKLYYNVN